MCGGMHMAQQVDCTTIVAGTWHFGIHGISFGLHTTFNGLSRSASKWKPEYINISGMDWTTSKLNHYNQ